MVIMPKATKSSNPKVASAKHEGMDSAKKSKIAKKGAAGGAAGARTNPTGRAYKAKQAAARKFFTVGDDLAILEAYNSRNGAPLSSVAKNLSDHLSRSVESIRDRLKRYISKMNKGDIKELQNQGKKNPKYFIHFKQQNKDKKEKQIDKICSVAPALQNRQLNRKPRQSKKPVKTPVRVVPPDEKLSWVVDKLQNKDAYFKLEFSVQLLADILNVLINSGDVTMDQAHHWVQSVHCDQNLQQVMDGLKVKRG